MVLYNNNIVDKTKNEMSVISKCLAGGIGCGLAGFLTNPCDVIKVRNQQFIDLPQYQSFRINNIFNNTQRRGYQRILQRCCGISTSRVHLLLIANGIV